MKHNWISSSTWFFNLNIYPQQQDERKKEPGKKNLGLLFTKIKFPDFATKGHKGLNLKTKCKSCFEGNG